MLKPLPTDPLDVAFELDELGLVGSEIAPVLATLKVESNFDAHALHVNVTPADQVARGVPAKTTDVGIAQHNDHWHPEISRECALDWCCALKELVRIYRADGNLNQWNAYKSGAWRVHHQLGWMTVRKMVEEKKGSRTNTELLNLRTAHVELVEILQTVREAVSRS